MLGDASFCRNLHKPDPQQFSFRSEASYFAVVASNSIRRGGAACLEGECGSRNAVTSSHLIDAPIARERTEHQRFEHSCEASHEEWVTSVAEPAKYLSCMILGIRWKATVGRPFVQNVEDMKKRRKDDVLEALNAFFPRFFQSTIISSKSAKDMKNRPKDASSRP